MAGFWKNNLVSRIRSADTNDAAMRVIDEYIDPNAGAERMTDTGDQHIHLHMGGGGGAVGGDADPEPIDATGGPTPPMNGGGNGGGTDLAGLAGRVAQLEEIVQQLLGNGGGGEEEDDGEDVELEDPETKDARRFRMRRGKSLKMRDEDPPVPDRVEEIIGKTDLPAIEDLDYAGEDSGGEGAYSMGETSAGPKSSGDRRYRYGDSADMEGTWADAIAAAEVITPGVRVPTFDARLTPARTAMRLCAFRRQTLDRALKEEYTAQVLEDVVGIKTADQVKSLGCDTIKMAFNATASTIKSQVNGGQMTRSVSTGDSRSRGRDNGVNQPITLAEIQRRNQEAWKNGEFKTPV